MDQEQELVREEDPPNERVHGCASDSDFAMFFFDLLAEQRH